MGQETYVLLKTKWQSIPKEIEQIVADQKDTRGSFLVGNVVLPACLIWTPINYHDIYSDDPEVPRQQLINEIPQDLLLANIEPRGVLLFPDGGEPRRLWSSSTNYEQIENQCSSIGRWILLDPEDFVSHEEASKVDRLLLTLSENEMVFLLTAKIQRDFHQVEALMLNKLGRQQYAQIEPPLKKWFYRKTNKHF